MTIFPEYITRYGYDRSLYYIDLKNAESRGLNSGAVRISGRSSRVWCPLVVLLTLSHPHQSPLAGLVSTE